MTGFALPTTVDWMFRAVAADYSAVGPRNRDRGGPETPRPLSVLVAADACAEAGLRHAERALRRIASGEIWFGPRVGGYGEDTWVAYPHSGHPTTPTADLGRVVTAIIRRAIDADECEWLDRQSEADD